MKYLVWIILNVWIFCTEQVPLLKVVHTHSSSSIIRLPENYEKHVRILKMNFYDDKIIFNLFNCQTPITTLNLPENLFDVFEFSLETIYETFKNSKQENVLLFDDSRILTYDFYWQMFKYFKNLHYLNEKNITKFFDIKNDHIDVHTVVKFLNLMKLMEFLNEESILDSHYKTINNEWISKFSKKELETSLYKALIEEDGWILFHHYKNQNNRNSKRYSYIKNENYKQLRNTFSFRNTYFEYKNNLISIFFSSGSDKISRIINYIYDLPDLKSSPLKISVLGSIKVSCNSLLIQYINTDSKLEDIRLSTDNRETIVDMVFKSPCDLIFTQVKSTLYATDKKKLTKKYEDLNKYLNRYNQTIYDDLDQLVFSNCSFKSISDNYDMIIDNKCLRWSHKIFSKDEIEEINRYLSFISKIGRAHV